MEERGIDAGARNLGRLALAWIPYALGLGFMAWLGAYSALHDFWNVLSQEQRRAIYVAAEQRPKDALKILVSNSNGLKITKVDLEGSTAAVYFQNLGHDKEGFIEIRWQLMSPDNTLLKSGAHFSENIGGPHSISPGEKAEAVFKDIAEDDRAASIRFSISGQ